MTSLPTIQKEYESYEVQLENNNVLAESLLEQIFPNINIPLGDVYQILSFLQETKVNAQILPRVIRGINNLIIGTGKGQVIIHVQGETVNVQTRETDQDIKTSI